ncbi:heterokaryon incompatibility protein-domain-containing protein [Trichophaea hybrida]|nr:heterokaryon incompatibility protein-domain-containing protein [Trichophaea hybrida]
MQRLHRFLKWGPRQNRTHDEPGQPSEPHPAQQPELHPRSTLRRPDEPEDAEYLAIVELWKKLEEENPIPDLPPEPSFYLPDSADEDQTLCAVCRKIDFKAILRYKKQFHNGPQEFSTKPIPLGFLTDIRNKTDCAFCRLVTATVKKGWRVLTFDSCSRLDLVQCSLRCEGVKGDRPGEGARIFCIDAQPQPFEVTEMKTLTDEVDLNEIQLLGDDAHLVGRLPTFHGRRTAVNRIDFPLIKEWMLVCEGFHEKDCEAERQKNVCRIPSCLRVIDVEKNRLAAVNSGASGPLRYLALSYVWGRVSTVSQYRTTTSNFEQRMEKDGLSGVAFPKTIRHAMSLTLQLGERYLWVDAVCIIQDDPEDQKAQIGCMNIIYGASFLTIIAAGGDNAEVGLPRAYSNRPLVQHIERVQGLRLALPFRRLKNTIISSHWFTRGWTYQERMLPCRRLYFTLEQVYFECRRCTFCEDVAAEERSYEYNIYQAISSGGNVLASRDEPRSPGFSYTARLFFSAYGIVVNQYTERNLTFESDVLNAFLGVANVLANCYGPKFTFKYGMPVWSLNEALLWQPSNRLKRRYSENPEVYLPSWSWAGWKGHVHYRTIWMGIGYSSVSQSIVSDWKIHTPDGETIRLEVEEKKIAITTTRELYTPSPPPSFIIAAPPTLIHPGVLVFDTSSAFFRVRIGNEHGVNCVCYKDGEKPLDVHIEKIQLIVNSQGISVGTILLEREVITAIDICNTPREFILLSRMYGGTENCPGYDTKVLPILEMCVFNAMLIEWRDGIAYRLGLGRIHEVAWREENPTWKAIFLG